jgi:hypothetical protein
MRFLPRAILAGGLGLAVSLSVAACGGGAGLLSSDQSNSINSQLSNISSALQAGDCSTVSKTTVSLARSVAALPGTINPTLRQNLDQGVSTVGQLANQQCRPSSSSTTTPTTSSSTSTSTSSSSTTPTQPTTTSSSPPPTTSTSSSPPATTPASPGTTSTGSGGAGLGNNGNGNGNGNGGGGGGSQGGGASPGPAGAVTPGTPGGASADKGSHGGK